jgi:hypothetical protein
MLIGRQISIRPLLSDDIGPLHASSLDLESRGPVVEKSGFTQEAMARASWCDRGQWHDAAAYTITRTEFEASRGAAASPAAAG